MPAPPLAPPTSVSAASRSTPGSEPAVWRVHTALLIAQVLFGGFHVVGKMVLGTVPPLVLASLRVLVATPLLLLMAWRHDHLLPARRGLLLLGILGVFANQVLFLLGLERTTAVNASILMPSMPVFTVAIAALLGIERIGPRRLLGVALSAAGAIVLVGPDRLSLGSSVAFGNALILTNCLCYSIFLVLQKPLFDRIPWRTTIAWSFLLGGLPVLPLSAPSWLTFHPGALSFGTWAGVAYVTLGATLGAYALSTWAVRRTSPALVAAATTLQPPLAGVLALMFLGERWGWRQAAGFLLIAAGLWFVARRAATPPTPQPATNSA
jgi:drug/metabolite transporter (DMT)-like permease